MKIRVNVNLNDGRGSCKKVHFHIDNRDLEGMNKYEIDKYIEEEAADVAMSDISYDWEIIDEE